MTLQITHATCPGAAGPASAKRFLAPQPCPGGCSCTSQRCRSALRAPRPNKIVFEQQTRAVERSAPLIPVSLVQLSHSRLLLLLCKRAQSCTQAQARSRVAATEVRLCPWSPTSARSSGLSQENRRIELSYPLSAAPTCCVRRRKRNCRLRTAL